MFHHFDRVAIAIGFGIDEFDVAVINLGGGIDDFEDPGGTG
jgi:hypothetical protein